MSYVRILRQVLPLGLRESLNKFRWKTGAKVSYSAFGEDLVVRSWLEEGAKVPYDRIRYLDIGANHPTRLSNSYLLYSLGGRGVVVEPNPADGEALRLHRPRDTLLVCGVAFDERTEATFYQFPSSVFNTFDESAAMALDSNDAAWAVGEKIIRRTSIQLRRVMDIATEHFPDGVCHFLSIDVEGMDAAILKTMDFERFRPWLICMEGSMALFESIPELATAGYRMLAVTPHNVIIGRTDKLPL